MNTLEIRGMEYKLPSMTLKVKEKIDHINTVNASQNTNNRTKYQGMLDFIVEMTGEDAAKEILESETLSIDDMDLPTITVAYLGICLAFDKPQIEAERARNAARFNATIDKDVVKTLSEIANSTNAMTKVANMNKLGK